MGYPLILESAHTLHKAHEMQMHNMYKYMSVTGLVPGQFAFFGVICPGMPLYEGKQSVKKKTWKFHSSSLTFLIHKNSRPSSENMIVNK